MYTIRTLSLSLNLFYSWFLIRTFCKSTSFSSVIWRCTKKFTMQELIENLNKKASAQCNLLFFSQLFDPAACKWRNYTDASQSNVFQRNFVMNYKHNFKSSSLHAWIHLNHITAAATGSFPLWLYIHSRSITHCIEASICLQHVCFVYVYQHTNWINDWKINNHQLSWLNWINFFFISIKLLYNI